MYSNNSKFNLTIKSFQICLFISFISLSAAGETENWCESHGGKVVKMVFQIDNQKGNYEFFCQIKKDSNVGLIGLHSFGSKKFTIASTYAKKHSIASNEKIEGPYYRADYNLCLKLGGSCAGYNYSGGYSDVSGGGVSDMCVFGDGSMISTWTLLYIVTGQRDDIKNNIRSNTYAIPIPKGSNYQERRSRNLS